MNDSRLGIEASRMQRQIEKMIAERFLQDYNDISQTRDRSQFAGFQVRSFAGSQNFAVFGGGSSNGSGNFVGA